MGVGDKSGFVDTLRRYRVALTAGLVAVGATVANAQTEYQDVIDAGSAAFTAVAAVVVTIMVFYVGIRQVRKGLGGGR